MAYEISEAFYAGLSLVDTDRLTRATIHDSDFAALYSVAKQNFASDAIKDKRN